MRNLTVKLDDNLLDAIGLVAASQGVTKATFIEHAVRNEMNRRASKWPELCVLMDQVLKEGGGPR